VLAGTSYLVGREAVGDWLTAAVAVASLLIITVWKKVPEPAVIAVAGAIGLLAYQIVRPEWLLR
jgi:chromate transporter